MQGVVESGKVEELGSGGIKSLLGRYECGVVVRSVERIDCRVQHSGASRDLFVRMRLSGKRHENRLE